jgi:hypothetical protein
MSQDSESFAKAANAVNEAIDKIAKNNIDPDKMAYVMITAAYNMLLRNNIDNPFLVSSILAGGMQTAVQSIMEDDDDEEVVH